MHIKRNDLVLDTLIPSLNQGTVTLPPQIRLAPYLSALKIDLSKLPKIIHAVGTNGKGSVLHYIKALLSLRNLTCHRFTSPHLQHYTERIEISGHEISVEMFNIYLERLIELDDLSKLSFFDILTLIMLQAFTETPADYCLIEAGLGGRLDSTNLDYPSPVIRVITAISLDHCDLLGSTLDKIVKEKRAVIRAQDSVHEMGCIDKRLLNIDLPEMQKQNLSLALQVIENECHIIASQQFQLFVIARSACDVAISLNGRARSPRRQRLLAMTGLCMKHFWNHDTCFSQDEIEKTSQKIWKGRYQDITDAFCQKFQLQKSGNRFFVDGAHNIEGIQTLIKHFGYKHVTYIVRPNKNKAGWQEILSEINTPNLLLIDKKLDEKIELIQNSKDQTFVFCGSLYWVSEILKQSS